MPRTPSALSPNPAIQARRRPAADSAPTGKRSDGQIKLVVGASIKPSGKRTPRTHAARQPENVDPVAQASNARVETHTPQATMRAAPGFSETAGTYPNANLHGAAEPAPADAAAPKREPRAKKTDAPPTKERIAELRELGNMRRKARTLLRDGKTAINPEKPSHERLEATASFLGKAVDLLQIAAPFIPGPWGKIGALALQLRASNVTGKQVESFVRKGTKVAELALDKRDLSHPDVKGAFKDLGDDVGNLVTQVMIDRFMAKVGAKAGASPKTKVA